MCVSMSQVLICNIVVNAFHVARLARFQHYWVTGKKSIKHPAEKRIDVGMLLDPNQCSVAILSVVQ